MLCSAVVLGSDGGGAVVPEVRERLVSVRCWANEIAPEMGLALGGGGGGGGCGATFNVAGKATCADCSWVHVDLVSRCWLRIPRS